MALGWFAARFWIGTEERAARAIDAVDQRGFCPLVRRRWVVRGAKREVLVPLLTGYVFVEMMRFDAWRWHDVANQRGFLGFIGGPQPDPVTPGLLDGWLELSGAAWELEIPSAQEERVRYRRGDLVQVRAHPELRGHVEYVENNGRTVQVTLRMFNRPQRVPVEIDHLELLEAHGKRARQPWTLADLPVRRQNINI